MTVQQRQFLASGMGLCLLLLLLLLASLDDLFQPEPPQTVMLRQVQMSVPPPPPPPPPTSQQENASNAGPPMLLTNQNKQISLELMDLDVNMTAGQFGNFGTGIAGISDGLGVDWDGVSLSDLDGFPMVLSSPVLTYPLEAIQSNVDQFEVMFHIYIDEAGNAYPVQIVSNPYPSMTEELLEFAAGVRFTPPTRLGIAVKTEYLWPVVFRRN
mgnify:CR=1 FL=1